MSHNIDTECACDVADVKSASVMDMMEKAFGWKVLGPGVIVGDLGERTQCEERIAIPNRNHSTIKGGDGSTFGQKMTGAEAEKMGVPAQQAGSYSIVGINSIAGEKKQVMHPALKKMVDVEGPKTMKITSDGYAQVDKITQKMMGAIQAAKFASRATNVVNKLRAKGRTDVPTPQEINAGVVDGLRTMKAIAI